MQFIADLWLPIVLSPVLVFVVSSIVHMVLPIHRGDYGRLPNEDDVLADMRTRGVPPGQYMFPCPPSMKDMGTPEFQEKFEKGPVGWMVVKPTGAPCIGKSLAQWFGFTLLVSVLVAYLASFTLEHGLAYGPVFRFTSTAAFLGYGVYAIQDSIWKGQRWSTSLKFVFDGLLYALVTAGAFAGFWPR